MCTFNLVAPTRRRLCTKCRLGLGAFSTAQDALVGATRDVQQALNPPFLLYTNP
jgi:hypothetical protein